MRVRGAKLAAAAVASMLVVGLTAWASPAAAGATVERVPVNWHMQSGTGPVGDGAEAQLVRRANGISFSLHARDLMPGHAYTLWLVVINDPAECDASPCAAPDIFNNPDANGQVVYAAGHVVGGSGQATFSGARRAGDIPEGWLADRGLDDPLGAEVHLVVNSHGPVLNEYMPEMIHTYRAGCLESSLPPIFPQTARDDGTPGPNTCRLTQVAVFP